jgi:hypothetical protein
MALTDISPTSGLALGYFLNFVVRAAASLADKRPVRVMHELPLQRRDERPEYLPDDVLDEFKLAIWIPDRVESANPDYIGDLKKSGKFQDASLVQDASGYRDINLLICREALLFVDIPTTLRVVSESLEWRAAGARLSSEERYELASREFDRFFVTLKRWKEAYVTNEERRDRPARKLMGFLRKGVTIEPLPQEWRMPS